ncbi:MAG: DUF1987 domain-containing protein [Bacteroidetes bacterium]|nr:MAG: DUF1987 domain-containing protein [Bacteroidota bacterium]
MEVINLEGTEDTPKIILDKKNGMFEISGRSLPEDSAEFYQPILEWLENYKTQLNPTTKFQFKLEYFNTASSKLILDILSKLEEMKDSTKMTVQWFYHEDDEDMQEAGEEFSELVEIPFEFETY